VIPGRQCIQQLEAATGAVDQLVGGPVVEPGRPGMDHHQSDAEFLGRSTNPQVEGGVLFLEIGPPHHDGVGPIDVGDLGPVDRSGQEMRAERVVEAAVHVVGPQPVRANRDKA
jgi:hypothetical protein